MTDRDRLIELIKNALSAYGTEANADCKPQDFIADFILANGAILPPCKVGDTVYMITPNGNIRNLTILGIDIELEEKEVKKTCLAVYEFEGNPCYLQIESFKFGKTVFLTKEEAESELEKRGK